MNTSVKLILIVCWIAFLPCEVLFSQPYTSRNNYTGSWESSSSWIPTWPAPQWVINGFDITINGYLTADSSLSFSTNPGNLIVNDTLVIKGSLLLNNNNDLIINDNGILIIWGDLTISNQTLVTANGYLVITGDVIKSGSNIQGSFMSNDVPEKVFIAGTVTDPALTQNNPSYPALNCQAPVVSPYPDSKVAYGNMTDLSNDPLYSFFQSACVIVAAASNSPVCSGDDLQFMATGGDSYSWTGPDGFLSTLQNPVIPSATNAMSGTYRVIVENAYGCSDTTFVDIEVDNPVNVTLSADGSNMCSGSVKVLTGNPTGGTYVIMEGPGTLNGNTLTASGAGVILVEYRFSDVCNSRNSLGLTAHDLPVPDPGVDQVLNSATETFMNAKLLPAETGEWSLISGSAEFGDLYSPTSAVTNLGIGENTLGWKVTNGFCEAMAEVKITVSDVFVPSVITPNGDGKNDLFRVGEGLGEAGLVVFNRWGLVEYSKENYLNDWDGRSNKGIELPEDTYFYIMEFKNGQTRKGSVLIKR